MQKIMHLYTAWYKETKKLPKDLRYSIGLKISTLFTDVIEQTSLTQFSVLEKNKIIYADRAIAKNDTLKFMLYSLYELEGLSEETIFKLTSEADEIGKILYSWKRSAEEKLNKSKKT